MLRAALGSGIAGVLHDWRFLALWAVLGIVGLVLTSRVRAAQEQISGAGLAHDGCSGGMSLAWRAATGGAPPWESCCDSHDISYGLGGSWGDRAKADIELLCCVANNGHPIIAFTMWTAVRAFGGPHWPLPWRWDNARPVGHSKYQTERIGE